MFPRRSCLSQIYMNRMNSSKKPKKKKKKKKKKQGSEEKAAEELFDVVGNDMDDDYVDGGDESENEEIGNILDSVNLSLDVDGDYDYNDLDQVANEDDDDLIGNASDAEMEFPSEDADTEDFDTGAGNSRINEDDGDAIDTGDAYDLSDDKDGFHQRKRKRKPAKKASASPFASFENYKHLLHEDNRTKESIRKEKPKPGKKNKSSK